MCWHKWSKWTEVTKGELFRYFNLEDLTKRLPVGKVSYQERICQKCGKKDLDCVIAKIHPDYIEV